MRKAKPTHEYWYEYVEKVCGKCGKTSFLNRAVNDVLVCSWCGSEDVEVVRCFKKWRDRNDDT